MNPEDFEHWHEEVGPTDLPEGAFGQLPMGPTNTFTLTAFDDFLRANDSTASALSNPLLNNLLGKLDQLAVEVVADMPSRQGLKLHARIYHSGDGRNWSAKSMFAEVKPTVISTAGSTVLPIGFDDGHIPSLAFVRVQFVLEGLSGAASVGCHVKCVVTCNDANEAAFTRRVLSYVHGHDLGCSAWVEGGEKLPSYARPTHVVATWLDPYLRKPTDDQGWWTVKRSDVGLAMCVKPDGSTTAYFNVEDQDRLNRFFRTEGGDDPGVNAGGVVYRADYTGWRVDTRRDFRNRRVGGESTDKSE